MLAALRPIRNWIFDLDNTLYPASANLFAGIDAKMTAFVSNLLNCAPDEALRVQKQYFHAHGTTLSGLMANHGVDPHHFLEYVHDVDLDALAPDPVLARAIDRLPGRKLVFTNGDAPYASRVLARLGLADRFEAIHDIHATSYRPKPDPAAYHHLCETHGIEPAQSLFVEDMARNLRPAKAIGMTTVWIDNGSEQEPGCTDRSFIDHRTTCLRGWLNDIMGDHA